MNNNLSFSIYTSLKYIILCILLFDISIGFFQDRSFIVICQISILLSYILFVSLRSKSISINKPASFLLFILIYFLVLIPFSSNLILTSNIYLKMLCGSLFYIISYNCLISRKQFLDFINWLIIICVINYGYYLYSTIFELGTTAYRNQVMYVGFQSYASQFVFPIVVIGVLSFYKFFVKGKYLSYNLFILISLIVMILSFRRSNFLILLLGLIFMVFILKDFRKQLIKFVPVLLIGIYFLGDYIYEEVLNILDSRSRILTQDNYFKEGRFIENQLVWNQVSSSGSSMLFGTGELFNSEGKYGLYTGDSTQYSRPIHNDYARILFGAGFIGLFSYFAFIISLIRFSWIKKYVIRGSFNRTVYFFSLFLITILFIIGISSGLTDIFYRSILFILLGFSHRILKQGSQIG